jgi:hypothetical protein
MKKATFTINEDFCMSRGLDYETIVSNVKEVFPLLHTYSHPAVGKCAVFEGLSIPE